jgi:hypothetical protein
MNHPIRQPSDKTETMVETNGDCVSMPVVVDCNLESQMELDLDLHGSSDLQQQRRPTWSLAFAVSLVVLGIFGGYAIICINRNCWTWRERNSMMYYH